MKGLGAVAVIGVTGEALRSKLSQSEESPTEPSEPPEPPEAYMPIEKSVFFDENPEFFQAMTTKNGEWTREQRKARRTTLQNGEIIFRDVGISFYLVKKGDSISEIRERLSRYPEFAYLATQQGKLDSFNIPAQKLRTDMWLPIPVESKDRKITEAQFVAYAHEAIEEIIEHEKYGSHVQDILQQVDMRGLVATMVAIAKQEGGGLPLGQFALHRWENHQRAFSFSYFHVLMKGPGLKARRKLNFTEGQLYHPKNAVKLFLGFLVEKSAETGKNADRFFPVSDHEEAFARFYNGKRWKKTNPKYLENIRQYYAEADEHLSKDGKHWRKDAPPPEPSK